MLNYLTYQYSTLVTIRPPFSCDLASKKLRRKKQGRREGESETRTNPILTRSSRAGQFGQLQQPLSTSELDRTWDIQLPPTTRFLSGRATSPLRRNWLHLAATSAAPLLHLPYSNRLAPPTQVCVNYYCSALCLGSRNRISNDLELFFPLGLCTSVTIFPGESRPTPLAMPV